jgi:hypothetical protein
MASRTKHLSKMPFEKEKAIALIVDRMTEGDSHKDVVKMLVDKLKIPENHALKLVNDSKDVIKNQMQIRVPFILSIHIERYEILYKKFVTIGRTDLQAKCLQQKEELLSLKNSLSERLTEDFTSKAIENLFNIDSLDEVSKNRALQIISKGMSNE